MENRETLNQNLKDRVDHIISEYKNHQSKKALVQGLMPTLEELKNAILNLTIDIDHVSQNEDDLYLASISKVPWTYLALSSFLENSESLEEDFKNTYVEADYSLIQELIAEEGGRDFARIMSIVEGGPRFPDNQDIAARYEGLKESLINYFNGNNNRYIADLIRNGNLRNNSNWERFLLALRSIPNGDFDQIKFKISLRELSDLTISLSSNVSTKILRANLQSKFGSDEKIREKLQELVPGFKNTFSTDSNQHWIQSDANTGKISQFQSFLSRLWDEKDSNPIARLLLEDMSKAYHANGGKGWGHDFSTTETAKQIRSEGGKVFEKTGYYPVVFWVESLADKGPHMCLSTIIIISSASGQTIRVTASMNIAMPFSKEVLVEDGVSYPAFEGENYKKWAKEVFNKSAGPYFKDVVEKAIREILQNKDVLYDNQ